MPPPVLPPQEQPPQEEKKPRKRSRQLERLREIEEKRRNPFTGLTPEEQRRVAQRANPQIAEVRKEEPVRPPPIPPAAQKEAKAGAQAAPVEARRTKETTKTEKLDLGHYGVGGKYEEVEGEHKVAYEELERISRSETQAAGMEREEEARLERKRETVRLEKRAEKIVQAPREKLAEIVTEREKEAAKPEIGKERPRPEIEKAGKARLGLEAEIVSPDTKVAGAKEEADRKKAGLMEEAKAGREEKAALRRAAKGDLLEMRRTLDEARGQNRPALLVQAVIIKPEEGPLDLLQFDEKKAGLLAVELRQRMEKAKKEQDRLVLLAKGEKGEAKRTAMRLRLRKIRANLAFYTKARGMLGRILGGFFAKLAGGLMKK